MEIRDGVLYNVTNEDIHFGIFAIPKSLQDIKEFTFVEVANNNKIK